MTDRPLTLDDTSKLSAADFEKLLNPDKPTDTFDDLSNDDWELEETLPFRRYRGITIREVARTDPDYLQWALNATDFGREFAGPIRRALCAASLDKADASCADDLPLTEHQRTCAEKLTRALEAGAHIVRLEGGAGYGKSFVTKDICRTLLKKGILPKATAVSYVATQVLAGQLDPIGVSSATLARTLKFEVKHENGEEVYQHSMETVYAARDVLSEGKALLVDEMSMVSDRDADLLINTANESAGHLILVGDSHQLPPVKQETLSKCCSPMEEDLVSELTIPMRYSMDAHLYEIEQSIRNNPYETLYGPGLSTLSLPSDQLTLVRNWDSIYNHFVYNYLEDPHATHRILAFKRKDVTDANNVVRFKLFGPNANIVEEDESLMVLRTGDTPFDCNDKQLSPEFEMSYISSTRYYSGQTFKVTQLERAEYTFKYLDLSTGQVEALIVPHYRVMFFGKKEPVRIIFGVNENLMDGSKLGGDEYQQALTIARRIGIQTKNWLPYQKLLGDFVRVAYNYATSVHRAQGATIDYAYCAPKTLINIPGLMGKALCYVAMTRAKKQLTIL